MTICYFGTYNPNDPRNRVLLGALHDLGIKILECNSREAGLKKYIDLYKKFRILRGQYDLVFVAFPGYTTTIIAKLSDRKCRIILDAYISYYDTLLDRRQYSRFHPRLLLALMLDKLSTSLANKVLTINQEYKKFFIEKIKVRPEKMHVIRKGADETLFHQRSDMQGENIKGEKFIVGWYGSFIPLHGVEYIIEAARILRSHTDIEFWLVGAGQTYQRMQNMATQYNLDSVSFLGRYPYEELPAMVQRMDVVLGIFSPNDKAMRCVTNKVYEAMAMGRAIVTEDSPANREIFTHGENVYLCKAGNGKAIADTILELKSNPELKQTLEKNSLKLFQDRFSRKHIAADLVKILNKHAEQR